MTDYANYLLSIVPALAIKAFIGLGFAITTYAGLDVLFTAASNQIISNFAGVPPPVLSLLTMGGYIDGVNMLLSALFTRMTLATYNNWMISRT